ncbi:AMP-binding protein [Bradyrhizobium icense]|uniref:AMP-dependent synthetase n=1 Tax=Bradyrhizobium icense TaxID=1274631 RepID=A0A1B1UBM9_9BRAD|nr:AMP-binding protein [Bradyrhizobium icense]ANW00172.1 AMP-dependent synthetase [Bradyrhizobium icense]
MSITASLSYHAGRTPNCHALVFEEQRISWRDLDREINRLAGFIAGATPRGGGVALHLPTSPALALLFLAIARAGREALVLDPDSPAATSRAILAQLSPALIVSFDARFAGETIVLADPLLPFAQVASVLGAPTDPGLVCEPDALTPFYVGFTSGSTGFPKGYRRHHRSWTESFRHDAIEFGITADDVILAPGTLTHSLFLYALVHGLNVGARVILCRRFRPDATARLIESEQATVLYGVPTQLQTTIKAAGVVPLASMRWILSSGAKWPVGEREALRCLFPNARFAEFYGASETSFMTVAKADEGSPVTSVGRAFSGAVVTIRDRAGRCLPAEKAGYVFVESPFLFMNYACGEASDLLRHGDAMSVGDIGFLDSQDFLHLVGRASRKIVTSGKNVYPEEIERVLERHPGIAFAAVLGAPDSSRGERLVALVHLRADVSLAASQLISHLRDVLPLYKVPRVYANVPDWPLTRSGKTDFNGLHQAWMAGAITQRLL